MNRRPTGLQLYGELREFLTGKGIPQAEFCRRTGITTALLANVRVASMPREETVDRIRCAITLWPNVSPALLSSSRRVPEIGVRQRVEPRIGAADLLPRVDRDPCPRCAVRRDIGCAHSARAVSSRISL